MQPDSSSTVMAAQYFSARSVLRRVVVGRNWRPGSKSRSWPGGGLSKMECRNASGHTKLGIADNYIEVELFERVPVDRRLDWRDVG